MICFCPLQALLHLHSSLLSLGQLGSSTTLTDDDKGLTRVLSNSVLFLLLMSQWPCHFSTFQLNFILITNIYSFINDPMYNFLGLFLAWTIDYTFLFLFSLFWCLTTCLESQSCQFDPTFLILSLYIIIYPLLFFCLVLSLLPWYNCHSWLGVQNQLSIYIYISCRSFCLILFFFWPILLNSLSNINYKVVFSQ